MGRIETNPIRLRQSRGNALVGIILILFCCAGLYLVLVTTVPMITKASPDEIQGVFQMASESTEAKAALVELLKDNPSPTRDDLFRVESQVKEILAIEVSRRVTGDTSIHIPTAQERKRLESERESVGLIVSGLMVVLFGFPLMWRVYRIFTGERI